MFKTTVSNLRIAEQRSMLMEREGLLTLLLAALTALTALSIDMSLPAMPQLQQVFHAGVAPVQLTLSLFLVGFAAGQLVCGPLSDRVGRRPVLLAGLVLFSAAGFLCAASASLPMLILGRCLQGMGASVGPVIARAIVRDRFNPRDGAAVLSRITQVMIVAPLVAPFIGGYLAVYLGWPAIFLLLGACGTLVTLVCWRWLGETLPPVPADAEPAPSIAEGFRRVVRHRSSLRYTLTTCFCYSGMFAYISGSPFVFIDVFKVPEQNFGLYFALTAASLMVGATVNRALLARKAPEWLLRRGVGMVLGAGILVVLLAVARVGGIAGVVVPMMGYLFGLGLVQPNATAAAMAPHGRLAGIASSLMGGAQTAGGALAGYCVGTFYGHTSLSLAATVGVLALLTFLSLDRGLEETP